MHDIAEAPPSNVAPPLSLKPFTAMRLAPQQLGDPASARAFARPYHRVAGRLEQWRKRGFVHRDDHPALYIHEYTAGGLTIRGLVGALDLTHRTRGDAPAVVLPHEGVHLAQTRELASRMEEMNLNPAPILLVTHGGRRVTRRVAHTLNSSPEIEYVDKGGQTHRFWRIDDPHMVDGIGQDLATSDALVADGHHRYAAYLDLQRRHPGTAWDRGLAMLVDQDDTPLHLGPIHRVLEHVDFAQLTSAATNVGGSIELMDRAGALSRLGPGTMVAYDGARWAALSLPIPSDDLVVCALHASLVPALPSSTTVHFHHTVQATLDATESRRGRLGLLLPAPEFDLVLRHGREGRLLPEKATSFQPKPHTGGIMRNLLDG